MLTPKLYGRAKIVGPISTVEEPDLSDPAVVAEILAGARRIALEERQIRLSQARRMNIASRVARRNKELLNRLAADD